MRQAWWLVALVCAASLAASGCGKDAGGPKQAGAADAAKAPEKPEGGAKPAAAGDDAGEAAGGDEGDKAETKPKAKPAKAEPEAADGAIEILELKVAGGVEEREPWGVADRFGLAQRKLIGWMRVKNTGPSTKLTMVWSRDGEERFKTQLKVGKSPRWRTWSRLRLRKKDVGSWKLTVLDPDGAELKSLAFEVAETAPIAGRCRALVNVVLAPEDSRARRVNVAALVQLGKDGSTVSTRRGLVLKEGTRAWELRVERRHEEERGMADGREVSVTRDWDELLARPLPDGKVKKWLGDKPDVALPDADSIGAHEAEHVLEVRGIFGPYVSLYAGEYGMAGGAHGYDDSHFLSLRAPDGVQVNMAQLFGDDALKRVQKHVAEVATAHESDWMAPEVGKMADLTRSAISWHGRDGEGRPGLPLGLHLHALLPCCTWVENHNLLDVTVPLGTPPDSLRPYARLEATGDAPPMITAPDGCGAVGLVDGKLTGRLGEGEAKALPAEMGRVEAILGVAWLGNEDPFDLRWMRSPDGEVETLAVQGRKALAAGDFDEAIKGFQRALALRPGDAGLRAELGWIHFRKGDLDGAEAVTREALKAAKGRKTRAMTLYNLGRIAEQRGEKDLAVTYYKRSLQLRSNDAVKKRLEALQKGG